MKKITALTKFLLDQTGLPRETIFAFADKGVLMPMGKHLGYYRASETAVPLEQVEIGQWKYDAVIQIERYAGDGSTFGALLLGWLADCDPERSHLAEVELNIEINSDDSCDIEIAVEFEESFVVVENVDGNIPFAGKRWSMHEPEITPAEDIRKFKGGRA